jgi:hypothetical protein
LTAVSNDVAFSQEVLKKKRKEKQFKISHNREGKVIERTRHNVSGHRDIGLSIHAKARLSLHAFLWFVESLPQKAVSLTVSRARHSPMMKGYSISHRRFYVLELIAEEASTQ